MLSSFQLVYVGKPTCAKHSAYICSIGQVDRSVSRISQPIWLCSRGSFLAISATHATTVLQYCFQLDDDAWKGSAIEYSTVQHILG